MGRALGISASILILICCLLAFTPAGRAIRDRSAAAKSLKAAIDAPHANNWGTDENNWKTVYDNVDSSLKSLNFQGPLPNGTMDASWSDQQVCLDCRDTDALLKILLHWAECERDGVSAGMLDANQPNAYRAETILERVRDYLRSSEGREETVRLTLESLAMTRYRLAISERKEGLSSWKGYAQYSLKQYQILRESAEKLKDWRNVSRYEEKEQSVAKLLNMPTKAFLAAKFPGRPTINCKRLLVLEQEQRPPPPSDSQTDPTDDKDLDDSLEEQSRKAAEGKVGDAE